MVFKYFSTSSYNQKVFKILYLRLIMELMTKKLKKQKFVRVILGTSETGSSGIKAPTISFRIKDATVKEVYDKIVELLENESK